METDEASWKRNSWDYEILRLLPKACQNARPSQVKIPVEKVGHVTHFNDAMSIIRDGPDDNVGFGFNPKYGKARTFKEISPGSGSFREISRNEVVMPSGTYLWFSVCMPDNLDPPQLLNAPSALHGILSPCLASSYASVYGTIAMMVDFDLLRRSYLQLMGSPEVTYKCGGTLLYRKEICRVIIVCCMDQAPQELKDLPDFPFDEGTVTLSRPFQGVKYIPNGDDGRGAVFLFTQSSWDTYVFAFHHPHRFSMPLLPIPSWEVSLERLTHYIMYRNGHVLPKRDYPTKITSCHKNDYDTKSGCPDMKFIDRMHRHANIPFDDLVKELDVKKGKRSGGLLEVESIGGGNDQDPGSSGGQDTSGSGGQDISGSGDQDTSGSGGQDISGSGDQDISGSGDQDISGSGGQDISGSGGQDISGSGGQDTSGSGDQDMSGSGGQDISGSGGQDISGSGGQDISGSGGHDASGSGDQDASGSGGQDISGSGGHDASGSGDQDASGSGGQDISGSGGQNTNGSGGQDTSGGGVEDDVEEQA